MKFFKIILTLILLTALSSCLNRPVAVESSGKIQREWKRNDEAQLTYRQVERASGIHDGSVPVPVSKQPQFRPRPASAEVIKAPSVAVSKPAIAPVSTANGLSVVLGPVLFEKGNSNGENSVADAGTRIREVISRRIAKMDKVTLLDSPEERFNVDSPRPDLARKGVKFVIKGVSSIHGDSKIYRVFLRAVDTATGKVALIVSGKHHNPDTAADEASKRLVQKLKRAM